MTKHYILGNGPSLTYEFLRDWKPDGPTWGVNRIWKMWTDRPERADLSWRPDFYVRCEVPSYDPDHVKEDLKVMVVSGRWYPNVIHYLHRGFIGMPEVYVIPNTNFFVTCD